MRNSVDNSTLYTQVSDIGFLWHNRAIVSSYLLLETNSYIQLAHSNDCRVLEHDIVRLNIRVDNAKRMQIW